MNAGFSDRRCIQRGGFTLIELLVVISIIALLMAILLPALRKARIAAKSVVCMTHLQQIGISVYAYTQDNAEYMPVLHSGNDWFRVYWWQALRPYSNSALAATEYENNKYKVLEPIFHCPLISDVGTNDPLIGYGWNYRALGEVDSGRVRHRDILNLNTTAMVGDNSISADGSYQPDWYHRNFLYYPAQNPYGSPVGYLDRDANESRHSGGKIMLWVDSHASQETSDRLDANFDKWYNGN